MIRSSGVQREQATTRGLLRTMSLLRPLMAGVLLLAVSTSALGPPNGTVGTLDFRYPNYIVDPLVSCPFEGYFPHPRDNTWFYRCYNRYGSSFFWRAYFQCQPCTVFSDAQDQCVFQETGTQCLLPAGPCRKTFEDCRLVPICPAAHPNRAVLSAIEVCSKTTLQCPGQPDKPLCQDGYVFDKTNRHCKVGSANSPCIPYANPAPTPSTTYVPTPPPTTTTPETTSLSTTTAIALGPRPTDGNGDTDKFVCKHAGFRPRAEGSRTLGCSERQFCDYYGRPLAPTTGCQFYLECVYTEPSVLQVVHRQCPEGQFFYRNINQCGGHGQHGWYDCPVPTEAPPYHHTTSYPPTTPAPSTTTTPEATTTSATTSTPATITAPVTITTLATTTTKRQPTDVKYNNKTFVCEKNGSRPWAEDEPTLHCSVRQFCDTNGKTLPLIIGCQFYLECDLTEPGGPQLVPKKCRTGQLYFYGNINNCGDQDQLNFYDCPQSSTTTTSTTTTTTPKPTPAKCTDDSDMPSYILKEYCHPSCGKPVNPYRYCNKYLQRCGGNPKLVECDGVGTWFDGEKKTCVQKKVCSISPTSRGSAPSQQIGLEIESPSLSNHPGPFRQNVLRPALFGPDYLKSYGQVNTVGGISSALPGFDRLATVGFAQENII